MSKKILVVDDEAHVRNVMALKLRGAGFEVEMASDGEEGFRAASEFKPDLVLSDYQMPRCNGLEMCKRLGADPVLKLIPVILVTSRDFDIGEKQREGTGIRAVKNKPFSPKDVLNLVGKVLEGEPAKVASSISRSVTS